MQSRLPAQQRSNDFERTRGVTEAVSGNVENRNHNGYAGFAESAEIAVYRVHNSPPSAHGADRRICHTRIPVDWQLLDLRNVSAGVPMTSQLHVIGVWMKRIG